MKTSPIKLSSPATRDFWEIPILYEDEHLLALNKPSGLLTSPDRYDPNRPNLIKLLHGGIADGKPWAKERGLSYLMNAHRLDFETSGVILLAKSKSALVQLANLFGSERALKTYMALVKDAPEKDEFAVDVKLAPHPARVGFVRVDPRHGKRAQTIFEVRERFGGWTLLTCRPLTSRPHQIRAHLRHVGLPIVADPLYGGKPLWLSRLKRDYHLKRGREERPLIGRLALHVEKLMLAHPATGQSITIEAPCPKDFAVALKFLRRFASVGAAQT